jgi:hypothetical protein
MGRGNVPPPDLCGRPHDDWAPPGGSLSQHPAIRRSRPAVGLLTAGSVAPDPLAAPAAGK